MCAVHLGCSVQHQARRAISWVPLTEPERVGGHGGRGKDGKPISIKTLSMKGPLASLLSALMTLVSPGSIPGGSWGTSQHILAERGRRRRMEDQQYWPNGVQREQRRQCKAAGRLQGCAEQCFSAVLLPVGPRE